MAYKSTDTSRAWLVNWMYAVAIGHLLVGVALPWIANLSIFGTYHRGIEAAFWQATAPAAARAQQVWWISLFGPTVQSMSIWMLVLIRLGDVHRSALVWASLVIGVVVWAPQDIWISLQANAWTHVWIDCFAVITMLPPLIWLWIRDRAYHADGSTKLTSRVESK